MPGRAALSAVAAAALLAVGGSGELFPESRLITPEWGQQLDRWVNKSAGSEWKSCYSSFTNDSGNPSVFHKQCDPHPVTVTVAHNSEPNHTFGGYVRCSLLSTVLGCRRL